MLSETRNIFRDQCFVDQALPRIREHMLCRTTLRRSASKGQIRCSRPMTYIASPSFTARKIPSRRFRSLPSCILLCTVPPTRRSFGHTLHKSRKTLLPAMRRRLFSEIQPSRVNRRCLLWHHIPTHVVHGLPADDSGESTAAADHGPGGRS